MKIYKVTADHDHYDACNIDFEACRKHHPGKTDYDLLFHLDGTPQQAGWWPRRMVRHGDLPLGDYVSHLLTDGLILRSEAIRKLRPVLGQFEVLPLDCDFGDYQLLHILDVVDCVDYENAVFKRFSQKSPSAPPRIMYFKTYAFHGNRIGDHHIFKLPDERRSCLFVDDVFVREVKKNSITGFLCQPVWEG